MGPRPISETLWHVRCNEIIPHLFRSQGLGDVEIGDLLSLGAVLFQEDEEERRDEIVDALNVARRRMADRPNVQDPLEDLLHIRQIRQRQWL